VGPFLYLSFLSFDIAANFALSLQLQAPRNDKAPKHSTPRRFHGLTPELQGSVQALIGGFKQLAGDAQWSAFVARFPELVRTRLAARFALL
jgi:hypothetical protein